MTSVLAVVVPLVVAAALLTSGLALAATRRAAPALAILLDLLLAAGLLRLTATASWSALASAALVIVIRKLAGAGIASARHARRQSGAGAGSPA